MLSLFTIHKTVDAVENHLYGYDISTHIKILDPAAGCYRLIGKHEDGSEFTVDILRTDEYNGDLLYVEFIGEDDAGEETVTRRIVVSADAEAIAAIIYA